jgi:hypothetical protein
MLVLAVWRIIVRIVRRFRKFFALLAMLAGFVAPLHGQVSFVATEIIDGNFSGYTADSGAFYFSGGSFGGHTGLTLGNNTFINVSGGTFSGGSYGILNGGGGNLDISGGTFGDSSGSTVVGLYNNGGVVTVSGGVFSGGEAGVLNNGGVVTVSGGEIGSLSNNGGPLYLYAEDVTLGSGLSLKASGQIVGLGRIRGRWKDSSSFWSIDIVQNDTNFWGSYHPGIFLPLDTDSDGTADRDKALIESVPEVALVTLEDTLRLEWQSKQDKQYRVWLKSDLSSRWVPQQPILNGTGSLLEWSFPLNGLRRVFAKVQVLAVPKSLNFVWAETGLTWSGSVPWQYQPPSFSGIYLGQRRVGSSTRVTLRLESRTPWPVTISEIRPPQGVSSDFVGPTTVHPWSNGGYVTFQLSFSDVAAGSQVLQVISDADNPILEIPVVVELLPRNFTEAVQSGRWHDPSTWYNGTLPADSDEVHLNGHTVTIDADATAKLITNQPQDLFSNAPLGGKLVVLDGVSITADMYNGVEPLINFSGTGEITIYGKVEGSRSGLRPGIVHNGIGTINVIGSVRGGWGGFTYGIENLGSGTINVVGTVSMSLGGGSYAIHNTSRATVIINGEPSTELLIGTNPLP